MLSWESNILSWESNMTRENLPRKVEVIAF